MEFKHCAGQNPRTISPMPQPLSTAAYVFGHPLHGSEFVPSGSPNNVLVTRVFPMSVHVNADEAFQRGLENENIRRQLKKEEIRRGILAGEMTRRREMEEEVRREMAPEIALGIPMKRQGGIMLQEQVLMPSNQFNQRRNNPVINIFGGPQSQLPHEVDIDVVGGPQPQLAPQVDIKQFYTHPQTQTQMKTRRNKDKVIILAKPDADHYCAKRKVMTPPAVDNEHSLSNLLKKPKQEWSCSLCHVTATSEKQLNDHLQGKKHKAKETFQRTQKIGLDGITPADT